MTEARRKPKSTALNNHWQTPNELFDELNREFKFDFDPCPLHSTFDGLMCDWGQSNFINPPYSLGLKVAFVKKAIDVSKKGAVCVLLLPVSTSTKLFHEHILPNASYIRFIKGRVKFIGLKANGDLSNDHAAFDNMIVVFNNKKKGGVNNE